MKRTWIALLLAALGGAGCCGTGGKCWNADEKPESQPEHEGLREMPPNWRRPWLTKEMMENDGKHMTPERVHGGIY